MHPYFIFYFFSTVCYALSNKNYYSIILCFSNVKLFLFNILKLNLRLDTIINYYQPVFRILFIIIFLIIFFLYIYNIIMYHNMRILLQFLYWKHYIRFIRL